MTLTASVKCVTHNKLQQQVAVTDHSLCKGQGKQHVTVTPHRSDKSLRVDWRNFALWKNLSPQYVAQILWFDLLRLVIATKLCFGDKDFHKNYPVHEAICRCDVSPRHIAATCRLVCSDLSVSIIKTVSKTNRSTLNNFSLLQVFIMILYAR